MAKSCRCRRGCFVVRALAGAMSLLAVLAGGCASAGAAGEKALVVRSTEQFDREVLQSGKPALVLFSKQGCAPCAPLYGTMDRLACEYKGRAVIARFTALTFFFHAPAPELNARYNIRWVPTVILFADCQPRRRWLCEYSIDTYRQALNEVLPPPPPQ